MKFCTQVEVRCIGCPIDTYGREIQPSDELALIKAVGICAVEPDHPEGHLQQTHTESIINSWKKTEPAAEHMDSLATQIAVHRLVGNCEHHESAIADPAETDPKDREEVAGLIKRFKLTEGE